MTRLSMTDASFLYVETDHMPMTIASVQVLDVPAEKHANFLTGLKGLIRERLHLVPYLTHRIRFIPGSLDHPVWEKVDDVDLDEHVYSVPVGGNGTMADLERRIAALHEERLDVSKPLWRLVLIDGLEEGRMAVYNACHHSCVDGMSGQLAIQLLMDTTPEPRSVEPMTEEPAATVDTLDLIWDSIASVARANASSWGRLPDVAAATARMAWRAIDPRKSLGTFAKRAPRTRFNVAIDRRRAYAVGRLPLDGVKAIGRKTGCKVNDVFLAVAAGGVRRYLERRGELPSEPLIAGCPVSLREAGDVSLNNQVTMMPVSLETHVPNPRVRLMAIRDSANVAKEVVADAAELMSADLHLMGLPAVIRSASRLLESSGLADRVPAPFNLVISNVPGPREQLYSNGAAMLTHFPVSIPAHGSAFNLTVQSYRGYLDFSITAGYKALPDATVLRDDLLQAYVELCEAVLDERASVCGWDASGSGLESPRPAEVDMTPAREAA